MDNTQEVTRADQIRTAAKEAAQDVWQDRLGCYGLTTTRGDFHTSDVVDRIDALNQTINDLVNVLNDEVRTAIREGKTYADIARALGVTRQAVHARYGSSNNPQTRKGNE